MVATVPFAVQFNSPNHYPANVMHPRRAVVIHRAEGSYQSAINWFMTTRSQVSSHLVISEQGAVAQCVRLDEGAWTNGLRWSVSGWRTPSNRRAVVPTWPDILQAVNPNLYTVTIELAGRHGDPIPPKMMASLIRSLQFIADQFRFYYDYPFTLIGHRHINPVDKPFCPGDNVNFVQIARDANTRWLPSITEKRSKCSAPIYQAPHVQATLAGHIKSDQPFMVDAITVGPAFNKFYHMASGQGFVHEEDVV